MHRVLKVVLLENTSLKEITTVSKLSSHDRKNERKEFELAQLILQDELYCYDCVIEIRYGNWIPFPN